MNLGRGAPCCKLSSNVGMIRRQSRRVYVEGILDTHDIWEAGFSTPPTKRQIPNDT